MAVQLIKVRFTGIKPCIRLLEDWTKRVGNRLDKEINWFATRIESTAKTLVPVDTGALKASISKVKKDKLWSQVKAYKYYAAYVEFGIGKGFSTMPYLYEYAATFKRGRRRDIFSQRYLFKAKEQFEEEFFKRANNAIRWK